MQNCVPRLNLNLERDMKVGDKVEIRDYSGASMIENGKIVSSGGWSIYSDPQTAIVLATGLILPVANSYMLGEFKNDTIIHIPSDGRTLFIRHNHLMVITKYCESCGQKIGE